MQDKLYAAIDNRKVAIIGAGFVGASIAYALTIRDLASEIVLVDIDEEKAYGEALDIQHGIPYMGTSSVRAGDYSDCSNCDLIIITAGRNRKVGEERLDMINDNIGTIRDVVEKIQPYYTHGVIMMVSNPVDILTYKCAEWMDLSNGKVFGTGCILDTSRLVRCIANYTNLNTEAIKCNIVGEHGSSQFPVWSRLSIAGIPMWEYCANVGLPWGDEQKANLYDQVLNMGMKIIKSQRMPVYHIYAAIGKSPCRARPTPACQLIFRYTVLFFASSSRRAYGIIVMSCDVTIFEYGSAARMVSAASSGPIDSRAAARSSS